ncbi:MAG: TerB family tellurite resistance protein [Polaromonas sp.]|nr:TerB family tellurite resistance protein [Polaromonas sp.]
MLSALQNLLTSFFIPDGTTAAQAGGNPQLATAVLLFDVMRSDDTLSGAERALALSALRKRFALSEDALAQLMVQAEQTAKGANDYFSFTSLMNDSFTQEQKIQVVGFMWQVAYADGSIDENENHLISKIAGLLHVKHGDYIAAKMRAKVDAQARQ